MGVVATTRVIIAETALSMEYEWWLIDTQDNASWLLFCILKYAFLRVCVIISGSPTSF